MAPAEQTGELPSDAQKRLDEYRQREGVFKSALAPPRSGSPEEQALYEKRVGIERVIFSLFPRKDAAKVAAGLALDLDFDREAAFIDELLRALPVPWLAPYLNLIEAIANCARETPRKPGVNSRARATAVTCSFVWRRYICSTV